MTIWVNKNSGPLLFQDGEVQLYLLSLSQAHGYLRSCCRNPLKEVALVHKLDTKYVQDLNDHYNQEDKVDAMHEMT